jgi:hypothetical protein
MEKPIVCYWFTFGWIEAPMAVQTIVKESVLRSSSKMAVGIRQYAIYKKEK